MYYIYHIPGLKVGCTNNLKKRLNAQGYDSYEVIGSSECILEASDIELKTQKAYGYKQDINPYFFKFMKTYVTKTSITFEFVKNKQQLLQALSMMVGKNITIDGSEIEVNSKFIDFIKLNANNSQYANMGPYLYPMKLKQFLNKDDKYNNVTFEMIRDWARDKGIYESGDIKTQSLKLYEEAGELARAVINEDEAEIIDAIGDAVVVLTSVAEFAGVNIEECIDAAYNEIKGRKGKMSNGSFVKSS